MAKEPLVLPLDGWIRFGVNMDPEELRRIGPSVPEVTIAAGNTSTMGRAQFDTGANHTCMTQRVADALGIQPSGTILQHAAGKDPAETPLFQVRLTFHNGTVLDHDIAVLRSLSAPHDLLIGRDILGLGRLVVDFTTGRWEWHIKLPAEKL
jgi:predicted aspartyl protease